MATSRSTGHHVSAKLLAVVCLAALVNASKLPMKLKPAEDQVLSAVEHPASREDWNQRALLAKTSMESSATSQLKHQRLSVFALLQQQSRSSDSFHVSVTLMVCGVACLGLLMFCYYGPDCAGQCCSENGDGAEDAEAGDLRLPGVPSGAREGGSVTQMLAPPSSSDFVRGQIRFDEGNTQFCITSDEADPKAVCDQLDSWFSDGPMLILSIFGGADAFNTDPYNFDLDAFSQGLVEAALRTHAWVITGGTKSGVMDLVGKAMRTHDKQREVPCIGISPFGALTQKWQGLLLRCSSDECSVVEAKKASRDKGDADSLHNGTAVQDNHTHSILIDNGTKGKAAYGTEGNFRTAFELFAASMETDGAPRVMILVNGGMISVQMVAEQISAGSCVVTCKGTGRAADALASLFHMHEDLEEEMDIDMATRCLQEHMPKLSEKDVQVFLEIVQSGQMKVYSYEDRIEDVILSAVLSLNTSAAAIERQLTLAVQWGCTDYFDLLGPKFVEFHKEDAVKRVFENLIATSGIANKHTSMAETVEVAPLISWMIKRHPEAMRSVKVDRSWKGGIAFDGLPMKQDSWTGLEGLLLWSLEHDALDSSLFAIWMHMEDPVHAMLAMAAAFRKTAALRHSSFAYQSTVARESLHSRADLAERLAIAFIKDLSSKTGISPAEYLFSVSKTWGNMTAFHFAKRLGCKLFVEAKFYRSAVDVYWMTPHPFEVGKATLDFDFGIVAGAYAWMFNTGRFSLGAWDTLSVPYVKAYTHGCMRVLFCLTYGYQVVRGEISYGGFSPMGGLLVIWALGYIRVEVAQIRQLGLTGYFADIWNILDAWHLGVLLTAVIASWTFSHDYTLAITDSEQMIQNIHSLNLIPTFARLLQICQYSEYFGTLLLTLFGLCFDAAYFFLILGMFCATMSCALTPILWPNMHDRWAHGITWGFWSIFGEVDKDAMHQATNLPSQPMRWLTQVLLYGLTLGSNILLVNLLIAIMNNTYTRYQEASMTHWAWGRVDAVLDLDYISTLPPPFNLLSEVIEKLAPSSKASASKMQPAAHSKLTINKKHLQESMTRVLAAVAKQVEYSGVDRPIEELVAKPESPGKSPMSAATPAARREGSLPSIATAFA